MSGNTSAPYLTQIPFVVRVGVTLSFMALLMAVSLVPGRAQPGDSTFVWMVAKTPTVVQKTAHVCLYAVLTLLWAWTLSAIQSRSHRLILAMTVAVAFGAVMEWYQTKVPGRFGSVLDVTLDTAGALLGLFLAVLLL